MDPEDHEAALIDQIDAILEDGPCPLDEITELLAEGGYLDGWEGDDLVDLEDQLDDLLASYDGFWSTPDGTLALTRLLLDGRVFTHRLTADELARDRIDFMPDLAPLAGDLVGPVVIVGGGECHVVDPHDDEAAHEDGSLAGAPGWLSTYAAGDLLAFTRVGEALRVEVITEAEPGDAEVAELARSFEERVVMPGVGEDLDFVVCDALTRDVQLFRRPVRPIGELLVDAGLDRRGEWVGPAGTEWTSLYAAGAAAERVALAELYDLDLCCLEALDEAMDGWNELVLASRDEPVDWRAMARALNHGLVAPAFADHVLRDLDQPHPVLIEFTDALRAAGPKAAAPAAFLTARNLERAGDILAAETSLQSAVRADASYAPALEELARYVADRGDAEQALNLLRRAGAASDDPEVRLLESMRPPRNAAGRNDRCPCGSGRKYKDCCQRHPKVSGAQRAAWLLHKLWTFTLSPHRQHLALALAYAVAQDDEDEVDELLDIGLPMDLAAFEGGLAERFLAERGPLLPAEEITLLQAWMREPRTLWRVIEHAPGPVLGLRETQTGRIVAIPELGKDAFEIDEYVYGRVGGVDGRYRFVGVPITVEARNRSSAEALIATNPNAWDIARWFVQLSPPVG
jgi:tetratricopeptide (TPR) repeat protein